MRSSKHRGSDRSRSSDNARASSRGRKIEGEEEWNCWPFKTIPGSYDKERSSQEVEEEIYKTNKNKWSFWPFSNWSRKREDNQTIKPKIKSSKGSKVKYLAHKVASREIRKAKGKVLEKIGSGSSRGTSERTMEDNEKISQISILTDTSSREDDSNRKKRNNKLSSKSETSNSDTESFNSTSTEGDKKIGDFHKVSSKLISETDEDDGTEIDEVASEELTKKNVKKIFANTTYLREEEVQSNEEENSDDYTDTSTVESSSTSTMGKENRSIFTSSESLGSQTSSQGTESLETMDGSKEEVNKKSLGSDIEVIESSRKRIYKAIGGSGKNKEETKEILMKEIEKREEDNDKDIQQIGANDVEEQKHEIETIDITEGKRECGKDEMKDEKVEENIIKNNGEEDGIDDIIETEMAKRKEEEKQMMEGKGEVEETGIHSLTPAPNQPPCRLLFSSDPPSLTGFIKGRKRESVEDKGMVGKERGEEKSMVVKEKESVGNEMDVMMMVDGTRERNNDAVALEERKSKNPSLKRNRITIWKNMKRKKQEEHRQINR